MADAEADAEAMKATTDSSSSSSSSLDCTKMVGGTLDDDGDDSIHFQCCVCLDLLYKPVVLACGHISCFWCVHKAMNHSRASHCAICRQPYIHFPAICHLLHLLLLKIQPVAYRRREKEVLEEERRRDIFSPQFGDHTTSTFPSGSPEEVEKSAENIKAYRNIDKNGSEDRICKQVSVSDVLCALCKELLIQPSVLNCGHVYCEPCLSGLAGGPLKCLVCQSLHPGECPNICLDLEHFVEEQFPREYELRKETVQRKRAQWESGQPSSSALQEKQNAEAAEEPSSSTNNDNLSPDEDMQNVHVGVGCDYCGMYPIIGKRYRCKDCTEVIGFDLCESCYNSSSGLSGRFNQQHTPDHKFEVCESLMSPRILMPNALMQPDLYVELHVLYVNDDDSEDGDDPDDIEYFA